MEQLRHSLKELGVRRATLQKRLDDNVAFLASTSVGMHGPLVDEEGFPRADLDLYAVRTARNVVAVTANDLKALEEELHEKLRQLHESTRDLTEQRMVANGPGFPEHTTALSATSRSNAHTSARHEELMVQTLRPFLKVGLVHGSSPAVVAGLRSNDLILKFGPIDADGFAAEGVRSMATVTRASEGKLVTVWVRRDGSAIRIPLVPSRWPGEGLVGCGFEPI